MHRSQTWIVPFLLAEILFVVVVRQAEAAEVHACTVHVKVCLSTSQGREGTSLLLFSTLWGVILPPWPLSYSLGHASAGGRMQSSEPVRVYSGDRRVPSKAKF